MTVILAILHVIRHLGNLVILVGGALAEVGLRCVILDLCITLPLADHDFQHYQDYAPPRALKMPRPKIKRITRSAIRGHDAPWEEAASAFVAVSLLLR
eukprot:s887_g4.t1